MSHVVYVITGPTAVGKSAIALALCRQLGGELISADAMQVYRGMDIGTAKASRVERDEIPHHLLDIRHISEPYHVAHFVRDATTAIQQIQARKRAAVICGGTGLYVQSLLEGIVYPPHARDATVRADLQRQADQYGSAFLRAQLAQVDPKTASRLVDADRRRIIRALEVFHTTGRPASAWVEDSKREGPRFDFSAFCLSLPRPQLYERINRRVEEMIAAGLPQEATAWHHAHPGPTARQAIGYKEFVPWIEGSMSLEQATAQIKQATRRYAKRQLTWFRRMKNLQWLDNTNPSQTLRTILESKSLSNSHICD